MDRRIRVFISSPRSQLEDHRKLLIDRLTRLGLSVVSMETFGSRPASPSITSLDELSACDAVIVLIGRDRGSIVPNSTQSFTELEYHHAVRSGIPIFAYIQASEECWDIKQLANEEWKKEATSRHVVDPFVSPEDLASRAVTDIARWALTNLPWYQRTWFTLLLLAALTTAWGRLALGEVLKGISWKTKLAFGAILIGVIVSQMSPRISPTRSPHLHVSVVGSGDLALLTFSITGEGLTGFQLDFILDRDAFELGPDSCKPSSELEQLVDCYSGPSGTVGRCKLFGFAADDCSDVKSLLCDNKPDNVIHSRMILAAVPTHQSRPIHPSREWLDGVVATCKVRLRDPSHLPSEIRLEGVIGSSSDGVRVPLSATSDPILPTNFVKPVRPE